MNKLLSSDIRKNRIISIIVLLAFLVSTFSICQPLWAQERLVTVHVNNTPVVFDVLPYIDSNNRTMVPLRFIMEELGSTVEWNSATQEVTIRQDTKIIKLRINQTEATIDGEKVQLDTVPVIKDSRTIVPLRFISENLGAQVEWDPQNYIANIQLKQQDDFVAGQVAIISPQNINSKVNIRSGPGTNFDPIAQIGAGAILEIISKTGEWYQVLVADDKKGWVNTSLVIVRHHQQDSSRNDNTPRERDLPPNQDPAEKNVISAVYYNQVDQQHIIVIEGTSPIKYDTFTLYNDNPKKLVVDVEEAILADSLKENNYIQVDKELISQIRLGQFTENIVRVVIDLTDVVAFSTQTTNDGKIVSLNLQAPSGNLAGKTIVIDPGHGSIQPGDWLDPGAIGPTGLHERVVSLDLSQKLASILEGYGARVIMTHNESTNLTLEGRAQVAAQNNADIFVSIHANANVNRDINGTMTFYYNSGFQAASSKLLAASIQNELVTAIKLVDKGINTANFAVLRHNPVPAVLVETAFISNYEEEKLLADPEFRSRAAEGIANGIIRYFITR